ncbi:nitrilase-related carbon-nitrogen hydrolase [Kribbella sp. NPDC051718]|uniref:nitrilase-related carbon-nitrogen hydrolase n=1 Tax=Kribbella sp. NPDC051718 TaxID=3155168 RepID=UPI00342E8318
MAYLSKQHSAGKYAAPAALLTGVLLYFGSGLDTIPALTWLAPLPVLLVARHLNKRLTALTAFIGWSLGLANLWTYLLNDLELPPAAMSFLVLLAGVFTLTALLFRALILRGRYLTAALAAPASWAAADYLIALVSPHGAFTSLAYTQADVHLVAQIASLTGVWGLTYLLLTPAAVVAAIAHAPRRTGVQLATALALVAIGTFSYGAWRLSGEETSQAVKIAIVSASNGLDDTRWSGANGPAILTAYTKQIEAAAAKGAQVVVLPEKFIDVDATTLPDLESQLQKVSTTTKVQLVAGFTVFGDHGNDYNRALLFHPTGGAPLSYDKHHLIPGIEPYEPGDHLAMTGNWGVMICKDLDFPALARQYGEKKTGLLLVPALDFDNDGWLHSRHALLRGIENGIPIARNGSQGLLTLSDAYGRVTTQLAAPTGRDVTLVGDLRPGIHSTLYTKYGDWFAWLSCLLTLVGLGALRPSKRA